MLQDKSTSFFNIKNLELYCKTLINVSLN